MMDAGEEVHGQLEDTMINKKRFRDMKLKQSESLREKQQRKEQMKANLKEIGNRGAALENWTQCCFFMAKKNRYCNIQRCPDSLYCGNHRPPGEIPSQKALKRAKEFEEKTLRLAQGVNSAGISVSRSSDAAVIPSGTKRSSSNDDDDVFIDRIPCPIDPTHTIYRHNLDYHLKICNTKTREDVLKSKAYYCQDCNAGDEAQSNIILQTSASALSSSFDGVDVDALIAKIKASFDGPVKEQIIKEIPDETVTTIAVTKDVLEVVAGTQTAFNRTKHARQDASLVNRMIEANLIDVDRYGGNNDAEDSCKNSVLYAEFGAGKGLLGLAISCAQPKATVTFIERNGLRWKADKTMGILGRSFQRIRMDIKHCSLEGLLQEEAKTNTETTEPGSYNENKSVVVVAKHLCGVATDFAIRSLCNLATSSSTELDRRARGLAVATCCHHNCLISDYCGWEYLSSLGFTPIEFEVMTHWSGWAHTLTNSSVQSSKKRRMHLGSKSQDIVSHNNSDSNMGESVEEQDDIEEEDADNSHSAPKINERVPKPTNLGPLEMSAIGKQIKRIFDYGRVCYLRKIGFDAYVANYCSAELSPECYAIIARNMASEIER